ncbi:MAG: SsrA-binding protein SmpB [Alphaproteobacteria bacterium]|nr:SsrA-binding protein SmpB [Alphaproteobacteria bacterium]
MISHGTVAQNRKARHDYSIGETLEAGLVLTGSEVKSLRLGRATLNEAWAGERDGELYLFEAHIPEYAQAAKLGGHVAKRPRKLLLHRKEINRLVAAIRREGRTIVPLSIFFNARGKAKVQLGVAEGRKKADKRAAIKERDWKREKSRLMRARQRE